MKKILLLVVTFVVIAGIAFYLKGRLNSERVPDAELASYFQEQMVSLGVQDIGQPIEGFDDNLLMDAFPGLQPEDFNNVETFEGTYRTENGTVSFVRNGEQPISSAERTVSEAGYGTLLANLSMRLNADISSREDVDAIIRSIDATRPFESYRNEKLGFSISYPSGARIEPETESGIKFLYLGPETIPNSEITDGFAVTVMKDSDQEESLESYLAERVREHEAGLSTELDEPEVTSVNGVRSFVFSFTTALGNRATEYVFVSPGGSGYFLTYTLADPRNSGYEEDVERMIRSFELLAE